MEREAAISKLKLLEGRDLVSLAAQYEVTIWREGKKNKGWAGHLLERYLGLPINSAQSPNFGSWELKIVPLKRLVNGRIKVKETMAITMIDPVNVKSTHGQWVWQYAGSTSTITMIDPVNVKSTPFEQSHLLTKLKRAVICARLFESQDENRSILMHTYRPLISITRRITSE